MSQHNMNVANGSGLGVRTDINNALQALASLSSGASAPSPSYPCQLWADTGTSRLKRRNAANSAWVDEGPLDAELRDAASQGGFVADTGAANAYVCNFVPTLTARSESTPLRFKVANANSAASTINDGVGTVALVGTTHAALIGGELVANGIAWIQWNATVGAYVLLFCTGGTPFGLINDAATQTVSSSGTTDIGAVTSGVLIISGTTTITALGTISAGVRRSVRFSGALALTHNATSLILPGGANITTVAGDCAEFRSLGSGNWVCTSYSPASGKSAAFAYDRSNILGAVSQSSGVPTGAIVEQGTNASGNWVRWADGTQICWNSISVGSLGFGAINNVCFTGPFGGYTFSKAFVSPPVCKFGAHSGSGVCWVSDGSAPATSTVTQAAYVLSPSTAAVAVTVFFTAIGRWF